MSYLISYDWFVRVCAAVWPRARQSDFERDAADETETETETDVRIGNGKRVSFPSPSCD